MASALSQAIHSLTPKYIISSVSITIHFQTLSCRNMCQFFLIYRVVYNQCPVSFRLLLALMGLVLFPDNQHVLVQPPHSKTIILWPPVECDNVVPSISPLMSWSLNLVFFIIIFYLKSMKTWMFSTLHQACGFVCLRCKLKASRFSPKYKGTLRMKGEHLISSCHIFSLLEGDFVAH